MPPLSIRMRTKTDGQLCRCAAGLALMAHRGGPRPGSWNTNTLCKAHPPPCTAADGWNPGPGQEQLIARRQSAAPGAGFPQAKDKSGKVPRISTADKAGRYPLRISWRIPSDDIHGTYPLDLSAGLILNSRISQISRAKSGYPDLSWASKFPDDMYIYQVYVYLYTIYIHSIYIVFT